ncbi:TRAP transporter small permease [Vibrio gallicus]|uniref:TRAP transporter small permease n=1 Tax=Vibrio gallicus TaxID=190897 RepID=UPI0021C28F28|nr:TRAP transporter small permease [Vibrio gallicus]
MDVFNNAVIFITKVLEKLLIFIMWIMVSAVIWQVFTRFVINSPSTFTDELSRYLMQWVGILGGAYVYALKRHLAIEVLIEKLSEKRKHILSIIISSIVLIFCSIVLIYGGFSTVQTTLEFNQVSPSLSLFGTNLPMGYVYLSAPISGMIISLCSVNDIIQSFHKMVKKSGNL